MLRAFPGSRREMCVSSPFLTSLLLFSSAASGPEPGDILAGPASDNPAAGADGAGPASADAGCQRHHPDLNACHGPDCCCTTGSAGSSK